MSFVKNCFFRKNIPDYLYHLTTKDNYCNILRDGVIKQNHDRFLNKNAVFTVEQNNFIHEWSKTFINNENLRDMLIEHISLGDDNVVLKISTKNLDLKKLFIRNQKKYFDFKNSMYDKLPKNPIKFLECIMDAFHLKYGTLAALKKFFNKNKPYEYIYKDKINVREIDSIISLDEFLGKMHSSRSNT